jgi:hypothetical protein
MYTPPSASTCSLRRRSSISRSADLRRGSIRADQLATLMLISYVPAISLVLVNAPR